MFPETEKSMSNILDCSPKSVSALGISSNVYILFAPLRRVGLHFCSRNPSLENSRIPAIVTLSHLETLWNRLWKITQQSHGVILTCL
ncbi:rCG42043, partial [Rattus norvegicus]